tara:strand:- start:16 stop:363 length:348 start_codon:yes stop_codon:yes gene_type:complete
MSYPGEVPQGGISTDRAIQLIAEAREHDDFLYRTLFGNKSLPHVVYQLEHFKILYDIVNPIRRLTLEKFSKIHRNTLISTTSIDGKTMNLITETRVRYRHEGKEAKSGMFGGGGM